MYNKGIFPFKAGYFVNSILDRAIFAKDGQSPGKYEAVRLKDLFMCGTKIFLVIIKNYFLKKGDTDWCLISRDNFPSRSS